MPQSCDQAVSTWKPSSRSRIFPFTFGWLDVFFQSWWFLEIISKVSKVSLFCLDSHEIGWSFMWIDCVVFFTFFLWLRNKDVASKYFLTFYPGANEAAVVFGTSVGGWKKPNNHLPPAVPPSCDLTCPAVKSALFAWGGRIAERKVAWRIAILEPTAKSSGICFCFNLCFFSFPHCLPNFAKLRFPWHSCSTSFWLVIVRVLMPRRFGFGMELPTPWMSRKWING